MKELRAYRTGLRHAARRAECHGTRRLTLLDSSVVRGTASKGRSSSRRLNRIWKPVVPELLAADIQDGTLPVPTKHMPADGATRRSRTRPVPTRSPPAWLEALEASDYTLFDDVYAASTRRIRTHSRAFFFPAVPVEDEECPSLPVVTTCRSSGLCAQFLFYQYGQCVYQSTGTKHFGTVRFLLY